MEDFSFSIRSMQNVEAILYIISQAWYHGLCESVAVGMECRLELLAPASGLTMVAW
jgi:hypothetical protein